MANRWVLKMFEELARLRFFIPKPFVKNKRYTDKYPFVVMEAVKEGENIIRGKFPDEDNAKLFLDLLRTRFVNAAKAQMQNTIEEAIHEQEIRKVHS